jgi:hypothetical protein
MPRGPAPKDPALRQRMNKSSTRATLVDDGKRRRVPSLPKRAEGLVWHPMTRKWWRAVFQSPMADEYLAADVEGLYRLVALVDKFWCNPTVQSFEAIARYEQKYGLSPLDRRRLEWIVQRAEEDKRRQPERPPTPTDRRDLRQLLQVV